MPDITTTQIFSDGEKGITATKMNNIIANSVIQPDFVTAKPSSSTLDPTDQLLEVKGAGTYARITGQQLIDSVSASVTQNITPTIWSVRLRSFNAIGNSTFECDQRNVHTSSHAPTFICDRWGVGKAGTMDYWATTSASPILIPGTNFQVSSYYATVQLTTVQGSLGVGDYLYAFQSVEGPQFRELASDVHSFSILASSSVANLKFGVCFRDPTNTRSLTKLCSLGAAGTAVLFQFPNLPVFPGAGSFTTAPGSVGLSVAITLAAGSAITAPSNDVWNNGNFIGATGQSNFAGSPVNSTFILCFLQHEPGAQCSTPIDCPFTQNYDACLRYYTKSYGYGVRPGAVDTNGIVGFPCAVGLNPLCYVPFKKTLAKIPTITAYSQVTGAANAVRDSSGGVDRTVSSYSSVGDSGYGGCVLATLNSGVTNYQWQYTADTGW